MKSETKLKFPEIIPPFSKRFYGLLILSTATVAVAQNEFETEEVYELSPFTVDAKEDDGYRATSTLAGTRLKTDLKDVAAAITVITEEFIEDVGVTSNQDLLLYTPSTEMGGIGGNFGDTDNVDFFGGSDFISPHTRNRVRGLTAADNTFDFFLTDIPWDSYNISRIDLQRGPNATLFGLGSPAGTINATTIGAHFENSGEVGLRMGSYGSIRATFDLNRRILNDELGMRMAGVVDNERYRQDEAFEDMERAFVAFKYDPRYLNTDNFRTTLKASYENGEIDANRPRFKPPLDQMTIWWSPFKDGFGNEWPAQIVAHPLSFAYSRDDVHLADGSSLPAEGLNGATVPDALAIHSSHPFYSSLFDGLDPAPIVFFTEEGGPSYATTPGINWSDHHALTRMGDLEYDYYLLPRAGGYAGALGRPLTEFGGYTLNHIKDRSIFDYKNHLIDGHNKREYQDFDVLTLKLEQRLWNDRLGYELAINKQEYDAGFHNPFGALPAITIDVNANLPDFSPNPNAGRPIIYATNWNENLTAKDRDSIRTTVFGEIKEGDLFRSDGFMSRLIGRQRFTAVHSKDELSSNNLSWSTAAFDQDYRAYSGPTELSNSWGRPIVAAYLGSDLRGTDSPSNAALSPAPRMDIYDLNTIRLWDSHWKPGVPQSDDFVDSAWENPWTGSVSSQASNPSNYVGWTNRSAQLLDPAKYRDQLYRNARKSFESIESTAFVWQGSFWNHALVPIYGYRKDEQERWENEAPLTEDGFNV